MIHCRLTAKYRDQLRNPTLAIKYRLPFTRRSSATPNMVRGTGLFRYLWRQLFQQRQSKYGNLRQTTKSGFYDKDNEKLKLFLPARDAILAQVIATCMTLYYVCLCLSVCHKSLFYRNGWTNRASFWRGSFLLPILRCVKRKFGYL